jgi:Anti-sigma-K factor rskA
VNEDELAEFLESGRLPGAPGDAARTDAEGVRDLLADESVWAEPDPGGLDAVLAAIGSEAGPAEHGSDHRPAAIPLEAGRARHARRRGAPPGAAGRSRRLVLVAAAAAVVLVAGVAAGVLRSDGGGGGREVAIAGTDLAPDASATATVEDTPSGVSVALDVRGLPPAPPGTYYQAWVKGPSGVVTIGTFHVREGDDTVELWSGVELDHYPTLTVTIQQEGQGQESSGRVVLSGRIAP